MQVSEANIRTLFSLALPDETNSSFRHPLGLSYEEEILAVLAHEQGIGRESISFECSSS